MAKTKKSQSATQVTNNRKLTDFFRYSSQPSSSQQYSSSPVRPSQNISSRSLGQSKQIAQDPISPAPPGKNENAPPRSFPSVESTNNQTAEGRGYLRVKPLHSGLTAPESNFPLASITVQDSSRVGKRIAGKYLNLDASQVHQRRRSPRLEELALTKSKPAPSDNVKIEDEESTFLRRRRTIKRKFMDDDEEIAEASRLDVIVVDNTVPKLRKAQVSESKVKLARTPPKKAKITHRADRVEENEASVSETIPSSQSDEKEVVILKKGKRKSIEEIKEQVSEWRQSSESSADSNDFGNYSMDVDCSPNTPPSSTRIMEPATPQAEHSSIVVEIPISPFSHSRIVVPPLTHRSPSTSMGRAVTSRLSDDAAGTSPRTSSSSSKALVTPIGEVSPKVHIAYQSPQTPTHRIRTAKGVEDVKPAATRRSTSPLELGARRYADLLPTKGFSDSEDSDLAMEISLKRPGKTELRTEDEPMSPLTDLGESSPGKVLRKAVVPRSPLAAASSSNRRSTRTSKPVTRALPASKKSSRSSLSKKTALDDDNPFAALIKEKNEDEKRSSKRTLDLDDIDFFSSSQKYHDEDDAGDLDNVVDAEERRRLLGTEGEAIGRILEIDLKEKGKGKEQSIIGVPLWDPAVEQTMSEDFLERKCFPALVGIGSQPVFAVLQKLIRSADSSGLCLLLQSGALFSEGVCLTAEFITWLLELALMSDSEVARSAYLALRSFCDKKIEDGNASESITFVSVSPFINLFAKLGAKKEIFKALGLLIDDDRISLMSRGERYEVLHRAVVISSLLSEAGLLDPKQAIPQLVALLVRLGIDPETDLELRMSIIQSLEALCNAGCLGHKNQRCETEIAICQAVLSVSLDLKPTSRSFLSSLFPGGTDLVKRIAQWLAYSLLGGDHSIRDRTPVVPPLESVLDLLSPPRSASKSISSSVQPRPFEVKKTSDGFDETDYEALRCDVEVLSKIFANIHIYVSLDKDEWNPGAAHFSSQSTRIAQSPAESTSTPVKQSQTKSKTEMIKASLSDLAQKIVDTKAAHLDRSRVKAALQQLQMRVAYQWSAAVAATTVGTGAGKPKPKRLESYFLK